MDQQQQSLEALQDIKRIMERSSRFISLSGWSGIAAGACALAGAWLAVGRIHSFKMANQLGNDADFNRNTLCTGCIDSLALDLMLIGAGVLAAAIILAFLFTYARSKKNNIPIWGNSAKRLMWNTLLPLLTGGIVILKLVEMGHYWLIAPLCLIFYGLALVNGSKYTLGEVRYLGYGQIILGVINLWNPGWGLVFWAAGFGGLHIIYGIIMWWKYERKPMRSSEAV